MKTNHLSLLSFYGILLLIYRVFKTNSVFYVFLIWNLFLAYIPFFLSVIIKNANKKTMWIIFPVWLLFLPNAPYIITDIFHLQNGNSMPAWFDLLLLITFSLNGMLLFYFSLLKVHNTLKEKHSNLIANTGIYLSIILSGFGIYLGRYLRWNSWEIIQKPSELFFDIFQRILNPVKHTETWGFTIGYSILFVFIFHIIKNVGLKNNIE